MNLLSFNQEVAATRETLYIVKQGNFDLTDGMSEGEAEMWKIHHSHLYANMTVEPIK